MLKKIFMFFSLKNDNIDPQIADVRKIMHDLKTNPKWSNTQVAVASCCDEPSWAAECIRKFGIGDGHTLKVPTARFNQRAILNFTPGQGCQIFLGPNIPDWE
jgi:hypothetical protein